MKPIITEEMRYRERLCQYALKYGVTQAARRYHTNRQFVYRQLEKYDGTTRSLALRSRKPHHHPNAHSQAELLLIKRMLRRHGLYGLAEVYVRCLAKGYQRSYGSMCRQIRKNNLRNRPSRQRKSYTRYKRETVSHPGEKVQIDIKYVPLSRLRFPTYGDRYYQITAIDEYSRKRILKIVREKSSYETALFLEELEEKMGFAITTIQVDNGYEFVNDPDRSNHGTLFQAICDKKGYHIKRIRPYSPWQNGKVERSHREDDKILYNRTLFRSEKELLAKVARHMKRYNETAKKALGFRSPDQVVLDFYNV